MAVSAVACNDGSPSSYVRACIIIHLTGDADRELSVSLVVVAVSLAVVDVSDGVGPSLALM